MTSEKNYTNSNKNLYMDAGNQLLKIGYQVNDEWIIKKIPNKDLEDKTLEEVLSSFSFNKIYWGSVCKNTTTFLSNFLKKHKLDNHQITPSDFNGQLLLNDSININEVGVDILGFCYFIKQEQHVLGISFGTATVAIDYNMQLEGVIIGPDFFNSYSFLDNILGIDPYEIKMHDDFGTNTRDAIDGSKYFMLNGFINQLLMNRNYNKIFISGGNKRIIELYKNIYNKEICLIDEIVLQGFAKRYEK